MSEIIFSYFGPDKAEPINKSLSIAAVHGCKFLILDPEHYRDNKTCRCDDPDHEVMSDWGYAWDEATGKWTAP